MHNAFAATKKAARPVVMDDDDFIPMRFFRNGRPRPLGSQCTCAIAPNKYCWKCKKWSARPDIVPDEGPPDLWADRVEAPRPSEQDENDSNDGTIHPEF